MNQKKGGIFFHSDPCKGNLVKRVKSKFWRFLDLLINLSKSFWDDYRSITFSSYLVLKISSHSYIE